MDPIDDLTSALSKFTASFPGRVRFNFDSTEKVITFGLDFNIGASATNIPLDFDLEDVSSTTGPIAGIVPVDVKTGGELDVEIGAALTLDFGFDLDESDLAQAFFLLPTTEFAIYGLIDASGLTAELTIGGIGAKLLNGYVRLKDDITVTGDGVPASLVLSLSNTDGDDGTGDDSDGRVDLNELAQWFDLTVDGGLKLAADLEVVGVNLGTLSIEVNPLSDLFDPSAWIYTVPTLDFSLAKLDLMGIIKAIEAFLGFLSTSLDSELLANLPLVGDDLSTAAPPSTTSRIRSRTFARPSKQTFRIPRSAVRSRRRCRNCCSIPWVPDSPVRTPRSLT